MKNFTGPARAAILFFTIACLCLATNGCSLFHKRQPKSSFKIIEVGDRNPNIIDDPTIVRQTPVTEVTVERSPSGQ